MIQASQFVEPAKQLGFDFWTGVPCSFLTPFINYAISADGLSYISSSNEGDAVAIATGAALAGHRAIVMMQNSGLGNAISPLSSLNPVFRIPLLLIITLRGEPGRRDEPQHEMMGQVTLKLLELMDIAWSWFPAQARDVEMALERAVEHMDSVARPYALVMRKGAVAPYKLAQPVPVKRSAAAHNAPPAGAGSGLPRRRDVLRELVAVTTPADTVLLASTGFCGRELYAIEDRPNQLYMVGSMGCVAALGLGLSLMLPEVTVVVIDGDGSALMRMGNMATIGAYAGDNFYHLLLDNHMHESTGGQATVSALVDFPAIAAACGYQSTLCSAGLSEMAGFLRRRAPAFMQIETTSGVADSLPRPSARPADVARRLLRHLGVCTAWAKIS